MFDIFYNIATFIKKLALSLVNMWQEHLVFHKVAHFLECEGARGYTRPHTPGSQRMVASRGVGVRVCPCMDPPAVTHCRPRNVYVGTAVPAIVIKGAINHYICAKQGRCCHGDPNDLRCFAYQQKKFTIVAEQGRGFNWNLQTCLALPLSFILSFTLIVNVQIALQQSFPQLIKITPNEHRKGRGRGMLST